MFALGVTIYQLISFDLVTSWSTLVMNSRDDVIHQFITSHMKSNYSDLLVQLIKSMVRFQCDDRINVSQVLEKLSPKKKETSSPSNNNQNKQPSHKRPQHHHPLTFILERSF